MTTHKVDQEMVYCVNCDDENQYEIREEFQENTIKGVTFKTKTKNAYCSKCGGLVYIPSLNDSNLAKINYNYRLNTGTIMIPEIKELLEIYNIGAKPLSTLLDWGECTVPRYLKGMIPSKEHSKKLKSIKDPYVFNKYFELNKEAITDVAKNKIEESLSCYLRFRDSNNIIAENSLIEYFDREVCIFNGYTKFSLIKLINTITFFSENCFNVFKTKMNKLLWYSDMFCYKKYKHSITGLTYIHHNYGPVPERYDWIFGSLSDFYISLEENDYGTIITSLKEFNDNLFIEEEIEVMKRIAEKFKYWYAGDLTEHSHNEKPYLETKLGCLIPYSDEINIS